MATGQKVMEKVEALEVRMDEVAAQLAEMKALVSGMVKSDELLHSLLQGMAEKVLGVGAQGKATRKPRVYSAEERAAIRARLLAGKAKAQASREANGNGAVG